MQTAKDIGRRVLNFLFGRRQKDHQPPTPTQAAAPVQPQAPAGKAKRRNPASRVFFPRIWNNVATLADGTQYDMRSDGWRRLTARRHERT